MTRWLSITSLVALLISSNVSGADDKWKFFKLGQTTEQSVILIFGTPDVVNVRCQYEDIKKANLSGGKLDISEYGLEYNRLRGDLNILKGPLGEASSVEVGVVDGKVVEVDWIYSGQYRAAAEELWKKDKTFDTIVGDVGFYTSIGSKKLLDGSRLFVNCFTGNNRNCDGDIKVMLMPPTSDKK